MSSIFQILPSIILNCTNKSLFTQNIYIAQYLKCYLKPTYKFIEQRDWIVLLVEGEMLHVRHHLSMFARIQ